MSNSAAARCDVLVVGGGPAGSSCAMRLQRAGLSVIVIDKAAFPRDKTCAGWITPPIVRLLDLSLDDYRRECIAQPITGFRTGVVGRTSAVETDYGEEVSYGIRRCEFDNYLLRRCGAVLRLGESVRSFERDADGWIVNDDLRAKLIVGAGGHFCPIAKHLNPERESSDVVVQAQEIEFLMTPEQQQECSVSREMPELYFCPDLKGYGWCFRKGDFLNVGLGREGEHHLRDHVDEFVAFLREIERIRFALPGTPKGHAYRLYGRVDRHMVDDGVLLIGDALGLASPRSGEGIRPAVESGILAADVILKAAGDYQRERLVSHAAAIRERFGKPGHQSLTDRCPTFLRNPIVRSLLHSRTFTRRVLLDCCFLHVR